MSSSSRVQLAYVKEVTFDTTPASPTLQAVPFNEGDAFTNPRDTLSSQEVQSTRGPRATRLGVNQPQKSLQFELQWANHDDLIAAAFGDDWVGGVEVTDTVTIAATTVTLDSGTYDALGIHAGDYLLLDDDGTLTILYINTITGTDNVANVVAADGSTVVALTVASSVSKVLITGGVGARIACDDTDTMVFAATGLTVTLAATHDNTWRELGFKPGDNIYFSGTSSNDGWAKIDSISANGLVLTLEAAPTNETINSSTDVDVMTDAGYVENGNTLDSFSFQESFLDHNSGDGNYRTISGVKMGSFQISIQPSAMVQVTLEMMGATIGDFSSSVISGSSTNSYTEREKFDSFTGSLEIDDTAVDLSGLDLTMNNQESRNFNLFERNAGQITDGTPQISGNVNAYFDSEAFATKYYNETQFSLLARMEDPDGHGYVLILNTAKFTGDTPSIGTTDVTEALPINVEPNSSGAEIQFRRQPAAR
jgi:hypothetical protein